MDSLSSQSTSKSLLYLTPPHQKEVLFVCQDGVTLKYTVILYTNKWFRKKSKSFLREKTLSDLIL